MNKNLLVSSGRLVYDPHRYSAKARNNNPMAIVLVDKGIVDYYRYFVLKHEYDQPYNTERHLLETNKFKLINITCNKTYIESKWSPHITVCDGITPIKEHLYKKLWKKYNNKIISFKYDVSPTFYGKHWALSVDCEEIDNIRYELGLHKKYLHITLGRPIIVEK